MEQITEKTCLRCGFKWFPRKPGRPATCPKCSAAKWDMSKGKNEPGRKRIHTVENQKPTVKRGSGGKFQKITG